MTILLVGLNLYRWGGREVLWRRRGEYRGGYDWIRRRIPACWSVYMEINMFGEPQLVIYGIKILMALTWTDNVLPTQLQPPLQTQLATQKTTPTHHMQYHISRNTYKCVVQPSTKVGPTISTTYGCHKL